jgi:anti-anti-sigma factor
MLSTVRVMRRCPGCSPSEARLRVELLAVDQAQRPCSLANQLEEAPSRGRSARCSWRGRDVMTIDAPSDFGVAARFDGEQVTLAVRGALEAPRLPVLGGLLEAVAASGCPSVVLDLTDMDSVDAAGLALIAGAASTLIASGGRLLIRSSSSVVAQVLDINWLSGLISWEFPAPDRHHLGPEQLGSPSATAPGGQVEVAHSLKAIAAIPANRDVVDGALRLVVALARATVGGADGASVTLRREGRLATVAASDQTILDMDADQYATGEGPCIDAAVAGRWFHAESLEQETRWPAFTPKARDLGISAILSSPLLARDQPVGALNIYSRTATAFAAEDQALAGLLASEASAILMHAGLDVTEDQMHGRLHDALRSREIIAEAQGVIMEREDISEKEAFDMMRRSSMSSGKPLLDGATDVVDSTRRRLREIELGEERD